MSKKKKQTCFFNVRNGKYAEEIESKYYVQSILVFP